MKKFLVNFLFFSLITISMVVFILIRYGGRIDIFYEKFTVSKQTSLILGDSRSLLGIQPKIIDDKLKNDFSLPIFNYSFTMKQVPFGKPYTESIKKKLKENTKNGLFIISVDPWLFTERKVDNIARGLYGESNMPPNNMHFVNVSPNLEYLIKNYSYFHFNEIASNNAFLQKDGWQEVNIEKNDASSFNERKQDQVKLYTGFSHTMKISKWREADFDEMIMFLKQFGQVVIVRLPIDKSILDVEAGFWPNFDKEINEISKKQNIRYFNFSTQSRFPTFDGHHMDKYVSAEFSKELCDSIKLTIKNR